MLRPTFVPSKIPNALRNIRTYQNSVPLIGNATCHFFFFIELDYTVTDDTFFFFFLRKRELDKTDFLCFTLTSGGDLYFPFFFFFFSLLQNAVIEC